jgi:hypothetical protein
VVYGKVKENVSAEQEEEKEQARFSLTHEDRSGPEGDQQAPFQEEGPPRGALRPSPY